MCCAIRAASAADPLRVLRRVVVAVLGGQREPVAACRGGSSPRRGTRRAPGRRRSTPARRGAATSRCARARAACRRTPAGPEHLAVRDEVPHRDHGRRGAEPERVQPGLARRRDRCRRGTARAAAGRPRPGPRRAPAAGTRSTDGLPAAVNCERRDSATSRFPPITRTRVPARTSSSILRHDGEPTTDPHLGRVVAGYRIEERIGRGGMGLVYRAEHLNLRRRAAIKIIAPELAEASGFRERFNHEARIAAALQHPNIVTVYDAGEVGRPALPRDAVHRGLRPLRGAARAGPAAPVPRDRRLPPGRRRARRRARPGPDPPRRQARQRPDRGPHRLPHRLRPDEAHRGHADAADQGGRRRRHDPLRRAGADRGRRASTPAPTSTRSAASSTTASRASCRSRATPTSR